MYNLGILAGGDTWGYYLYLPATFIHHDLDNIKTSLATRKKYHQGFYTTDVNPLGVDEVHHIGDGKQVNKYTLGMAILFAPFFFLAHFIASISSYEADGYSFIYIYLIHLSSLFYMFWGLLFLRKSLLHYFNDNTVSLVLAAVTLATNLYYFTVYNSPMAHAYLFFLYCVLIYFTIQWYQEQRLKNALIIGLSCGLITLIRPVEIISIFIPIFWGIDSIKAVGERFRFLLSHKYIYAAIIIFVMVGLPQLFYWKWLTGDFLYYSYGEEGFDFTDPHLLWGLFSYKNGWLAYTPIMYLALLGCLFLLKKRDFLFPVLLFLPLHIYITYSWWCWNYINGLGSRPMVETYALLSIPMAYMFSFLLSKKYLKILLLTICGFLAWLNIFNTYQLSLGILWSEDANWAYYKSIFGKTTISKSDLLVYDSGEFQPNVDQLKFDKQVYSNTFEESTSVQYTSLDVKNGRYAYAFNKDQETSPMFQTTVGELDIETGDWIRVSLYCMRKYQGNNIYQMSTLITAFDSDTESIKWRYAKLDNKTGNIQNSLWGGQPNIWEEVVFWTKVPQGLQASDTFKTYVWNPTVNKIYIDDFKVEVWKNH